MFDFFLRLSMDSLWLSSDVPKTLFKNKDGLSELLAFLVAEQSRLDKRSNKVYYSQAGRTIMLSPIRAASSISGGSLRQ